jgi:hypothetical protein
MARQQNTVAKRLREMAKKRKQEEKRSLRREKKDRVESPTPLKSENASEDESTSTAPS